MDERHTEQCGVCGLPLTYTTEGARKVCSVCGVSEIGHVVCPEGHYLCESCHGMGVRERLPEALAASDETSPEEIAERLLLLPGLPMLGCEHALIAAGSLMAALKNRGDLGVTDRHVAEALERAGRQAISAYCGLSGVCGIVPALGACYSVLVGGQCGKGPETRAAMELVSRLAAVTAEEADPGCCKAYLRSCLRETEIFLEERLGIPWLAPCDITCRDVDRHPHGCRGPACGYHPDHLRPGVSSDEAAGARHPESSGHEAPPFVACSLIEAAEHG